MSPSEKILIKIHGLDEKMQNYWSTEQGAKAKRCWKSIEKLEAKLKDLESKEKSVNKE